jgi:ketopantoate reductase
MGGIGDAEHVGERALQAVRWHKLLVNAAFNASAVLSGAALGNADMARDGELRAHLLAVMHELWDAAPAVLGLAGGFEDAGLMSELANSRVSSSSDSHHKSRSSSSGGGRHHVPSRLATPEEIMRSSERNVGARPSMLLDWLAHRPLEIEVILGNAVRLAAARGVALPRVHTMYALLKSAQAVRAAAASAPSSGTEGSSKRVISRGKL